MAIVCTEAVQRFLFLGLESTHTLEHVVPVDFVTVEFWAINADELRLAADRHAAATAHAGSVHHDAVEAHHGLHAVGLGGEGAELHHDRRTDSDDHVRLALGVFAEFLKRFGNETLAAIRTVVSHEDDVVSESSHFVLHEEQAFVTGTHDDGDLVACSLEGLNDRVHRGDTHATAHANHVAKILDVGRRAERAHEHGNIVTDFELGKFGGGLANRLENQGDRAFSRVGIGDGERHAFAVILVRLEDDKLAGLTLLGDQRGLDAEHVDRGRHLFFKENFCHSGTKLEKRHPERGYLFHKNILHLDRLGPKRDYLSLEVDESTEADEYVFAIED